MSKSLGVTAALFILSALTLAQVPVKVQRADLSIAFGVASGKVVLVEDYLVFADDANPENSFAVNKAGIRSVDADQRIIRVATSEPIRPGSTQREAVLRFETMEQAQLLTSWFRAESGPASATPEERAPEPRGGEVVASYDAKHDHGLLGRSCNGRLIISRERIAYDSVDDIGHSRQWALNDVKEIRLKNPYNLEMEFFQGNDYKFRLVGNGMDNATFRDLVNRVTAARVGN